MSNIPPTVEEAFESPRLVFAAACEAIEGLKSLSDTFFAERFYRSGFDESDPDKVIHYVEISRNLPNSARVLAYRIFNDLRNALDQTVHGASAALGGKRLEKTSFPFRQDPADLEHVFTGKGQCRDVPAELHDTIRSFEPYPQGSGYSGGDNKFRIFGRLSNPNKHSIALRVGINVQGMGIQELFAAEIHQVLRWNGAKTKFILFHSPHGSPVQYKIHLPSFIAFDETALDGEPVLEFVALIRGKVEGIINTFETETRRILLARGT